MSSSETTARYGWRFEDTHWSVVGQLMRKDASAEAALEKLCRAYRLPLYCLIRQRGYSKADAEDIVQDFLCDVIQREALHRVDPNKGRFRAFLKASLSNFLANEWDRRKTLKRGGGVEVVSIDEEDAEGIYGQIASRQEEPEKIYDHAWAIATLHRTMQELREEYSTEGRVAVFNALESVLSSEGRSVLYPEVAGQLGMTEEAVRMAAMRMRRRFGELLRKQVLRTVAEKDDADEELRYLFSCL